MLYISSLRTRSSSVQTMACRLFSAKLLAEPMLAYISDIYFKIHPYSYKKMYLEKPPAKWWPFLLDLNVLNFCIITLPSNISYKAHLTRQDNCWSLRCGWSIACRRCSNYIFILDVTPGFNGLGKDNWKMRQETFKFWNLVLLILEVWWYSYLSW